MSFLKTFIRSAFRRHGYQIQKYPTSTFRSVPVFDLSVRFLMATRGASLSFIQVGANDGRSGDPLHKYIKKYPWHGILVEPQPDIFFKLCENYAAIKDRLIFENIAIAEGQTAITMYRSANNQSGLTEDSAYASSVVSANSRVVARQLGVRSRDLEQFMVQCATLDELLAKHRMSTLDILQIDAEGYDYDVLKTLNLSKISPSIIQFEHGHLSPRQITGAVDHLIANSYRVLYGGYQNDSLALHEKLLLDIV